MRFSFLLAITASSVAYSSVFAVPVWNDGVDVSQTSGLHPPSDLIPHTNSIEDEHDEHSLRYNMHTLEVRDNLDKPGTLAPQYDAEPKLAGLFKRNLPKYYYTPNPGNANLLVDDEGFPHLRSDALPNVPIHHTLQEAEAYLAEKQRRSRPSNAAPPSSQGAHAPYPGTHHRPEPTSHGGGSGYTIPQPGGRTRQPSMSQQIMQPGHSQQQQWPSLPAPASFQSTTGWQPVMAPGFGPRRLGGGIPQMHPAPVMPQSFSGRQPVIPPGFNPQRGPVVPVHIASTAPLQQHAYGGPVIPTDHDFIGSSSKNKSKAKGNSKFW